MMNRPIFLFLLAGILSFAAVPAAAQNEGQTEMTKAEFLFSSGKSSTEGARYEIVISARGETPGVFKIDKYTGDVWELTDGFFTSTHKLIKFTRESDSEDLAKEGKINYQLIAVTSTRIFLLNLNTGLMWENYTGIFTDNREFRVIREW